MKLNRRTLLGGIVGALFVPFIPKEIIHPIFGKLKSVSFDKKESYETIFELGKLESYKRYLTYPIETLMIWKFENATETYHTFNLKEELLQQFVTRKSILKMIQLSQHMSMSNPNFTYNGQKFYLNSISVTKPNDCSPIIFTSASH